MAMWPGTSPSYVPTHMHEQLSQTVQWGGEHRGAAPSSPAKVPGHRPPPPCPATGWCDDAFSPVAWSQVVVVFGYQWCKKGAGAGRRGKGGDIDMDELRETHGLTSKAAQSSCSGRNCSGRMCVRGL